MLYDFFYIIKIKTSNYDICLSFNEDVIVQYLTKFERYEQSAIEKTAIVENGGFGVNNSTLHVSYNNDHFKKLNFETNLYQNNYFIIYKVDRNKIKNDVIQFADLENEFEGVFGNIKQEYAHAEIELRSLKQLLLTTVVETTRRFCSYDFCNERCGLDIEDFTHTITVEKQTSLTRFKIKEELSLNENQIKSGYLQIIGSEYSNFKFDIKNYFKDTREIEISSNVNLFFKENQTCKLVLGCDKTKEMCINLNNAKNFGGFSFVPLQSTLSQMGTGNL